ncbi:unnamed protein product [Urochloa humidicola]
MGNKVSQAHDAIPTVQPHLSMSSSHVYNDKSPRLVTSLRSSGDAAWSGSSTGEGGTTVPAERVFERLKASFLAPTVREVEAALDAMFFDMPATEELAAAAPDGEAAATSPLAMTAQVELSGLPLEEFRDGPNTAQQEGGRANSPAPAQDPLLPLGQSQEGGQSTSPALGQASTLPQGQAQEQQGSAAPVPSSDTGGNTSPAVDDLFTTPAPPLLRCPPGDVQTPIEGVLREYIKSITGPLPDYIIAALATLLDLDDDDQDKMAEALLQRAGDGVAQLQEEQEALMVRDD